MLSFSEAPAIHIVDDVLCKAIHAGASDIHCESIKQGIRVRFRIDGLLYEHAIYAGDVTYQVLARIKVLAHIDLAERRMPHDGKFRFTTSRGDAGCYVSLYLW